MGRCTSSTSTTPRSEILGARGPDKGHQPPRSRAGRRVPASGLGMAEALGSDMLGAAATGPRYPHTLRSHAPRSALPAATGPDPGLTRPETLLGGVTPSAAHRRQGDTRMSKVSARDKRGVAEPVFVQLLNPDGERVEHPDYSVDFSDEELRGLYRDLVIVRKLDAEATALQRQGELGIWASLLGQEAAQVGSGRALRSQDMAFPTYRENGVLYCRGIEDRKSVR